MEQRRRVAKAGARAISIGSSGLSKHVCYMHAYVLHHNKFSCFYEESLEESKVTEEK